MRDRIESWYREYGPALLLYGVSLTGGDRARAQDALHHVFLRLLETRPGLAGPRPYLFAALRNTILNGHRREARFTAAPLPEPWFEDCPNALALRLALADLPPDQREVLVLHVWGGLTFAQVAEVLGVGPNTAASRYRYGLEKLRARFAVREDS